MWSRLWRRNLSRHKNGVCYMKSFEIKENEAGIRVDKYARKVLGQADSSFIYKMIRKKNIVLNDKKTSGSDILKIGDVVKFYISDEVFDKFKTQIKTEELTKKTGKSALDIVYEDEDILVINKPAGMLSQKANDRDVSANENILVYLLESGQLNTEQLMTFRPSVANRLDRNTSGLLLAGKSLKGLQLLSAELRKRSLVKIYHCLVKGVIPKKQTVKGYLSKDERRNRVSVFEDSGENRLYIETTYQPIEILGNYTYLSVHLITGRSHQIRAHLSAVGHPVIGDPKYGDPAVNRLFAAKAGVERQLLHAYSIRLSDGTVITAPIPSDMRRAIEFARSSAQEDKKGILGSIKDIIKE